MAPRAKPTRQVLRRWLPLLLLVFALAVGAGWVVRRLNAPKPPLKLGLSPAFKSETIRAELRPLLGYLERELGRKILIVVDRGYMAPKRCVSASRLRVLAEAGRIPLDHLCAKRQLPLALAKQLQQALLNFEPQRDIGRHVIGEHFLADAFTRPRHGDFDALTQALRQEHILP